MVKLTTIVCVVGITLLKMGADSNINRVASQSDKQGISLESADVLHERLNYELSRVGARALYQGALANRMLSGVTPSSQSCQWDIYPIEKITKNDVFAPHLATMADRYFCIQVARQPTATSIPLILHGEKIAVSIKGASQTWRFPHTWDSPDSRKLTVKSLIERCSDKYWK